MSYHRRPNTITGVVQRILLLVLVLGVAATGCAASAARSDEVGSAEMSVGPGVTAPTAAPAQERAIPESRASASKEATPAPTPELAESVPAAAVEPTPEPVLLGTPLPRAPIGLDANAPQGETGPQPVSLAIEDIDVVDADVIAVGVNPDLTFEVPPADQVGWYRFGPAPGDEGSAVLAAHIAFDGVDGVFRHLADVEVGAIVTVGFDDGSKDRYRIETVTEYLKDELPDELFARDGAPKLALITCGGDFNRQLSSYESNVVAVAVPI